MPKKIERKLASQPREDWFDRIRMPIKRTGDKSNFFLIEKKSIAN